MAKMNSRSIITSILTVFLLGTGVRPFVEANGLGSPLWLSLYLIALSGIVLINAKWFLEGPLLVLSLLLTCYAYFPSNVSFSFPWIKLFFLNAIKYLDPIHRAEFQFLPSNMALLFISLFLMLLVKLIISYELWMLPFLAVLSYLLVLTVFNGTDHLGNIVSLLVIGLTLSLWLGNQDESGLAYLKRQKIAVIGLVSCLVLAWQLPQWLPKVHQAIQMQTQPLRAKIRTKSFYRLIEFARGSGQSATTGFSENDSVLGGAVVPNDELVFLAKQSVAHYWKVENKDRYTGRGWENSVNERQVVTQTTATLDEGHERYQGVGVPIELTLPNPIRYVPKPQGRIIWDVPQSYLDNQGLEYNGASNRFYVSLSPAYPAESSLTFEYFPPDYSIADLEASQSKGAFEGGEYLQLPDSLPARVGELARQLTAESATDYQRVKALERYLKTDANFRYSLEEAEIVPNDRDYVDFFLFDSPIGYCEHFSSAMVVLARSLDIPARWAKGFSEGRVTATDEDGTKTYSITNENAHAWPEIYFQGIGWVPFEPTKSFVSSEQEALVRANQADTQEQPTSSAPMPSSSSVEQASESLQQSSSTPKNDTPEMKDASESTPWVKKTLFVIGGMLLSSVVIGVIFRRQVKWQWWLMAVKFRPHYDFSKAFEGLLTLLEQEYHRHPSETLRHYQERLTTELSDVSEVFKQLTDRYESLSYGTSIAETSLSELEQEKFQKMARALRKEKPGKTE